MAQTRPVQRHHAVQFYGTEQSLFTTVGAFISEGLIAGQPALLIATRGHMSGILDELSRRLIDVCQAKRIGDLVCLDAEETLATFMAGDTPDPGGFRKIIGDIIDQTLAGRVRTPLRAYGEMVDVLWKRGSVEAAVAHSQSASCPDGFCPCRRRPRRHSRRRLRLRSPRRPHRTLQPARR